MTNEKIGYASCPCGYRKHGEYSETRRALNNHADECPRWDYDDEPRISRDGYPHGD